MVSCLTDYSIISQRRGANMVFDGCQSDSGTVFVRNAKTQIIKLLKGSQTACPDRCVGVIGTLRFPFDYEDIKNTIGSKRVLLVLESPHNKEFEGIPAPAKGMTGRNICDCWSKIFGNRFDGRKLCLVNAVKYRCSMGLPLPRFSAIKDLVFLEAVKKYQMDLKERLTDYSLSNKDVVIIACSCDEEKCAIVKSVIQSIVGDSKMVVSPFWHPVSWRRHLFCISNKAKRIVVGVG